MLSLGSRLGPYEIVAPLGAGGMGEVFRARDTRLNRTVALKVLPSAWAQDADRLRRFEQEARAAGALSHPNLLTLHDVGTADGVPYLVTELLEGDTLRERLKEGPLPVRKAVDIACQLARGLAAAHEQGIVHRDVKPENVFVTRDGRVKILDFGLARLTHADSPVTREEGETRLTTDAGTVLGTAGYLSPEQARGSNVDARTDIFALGAVLYEMLCGRQAFGGATAVDTISAVVRDDPPELASPSLSPALVHVVRRCLEKQPGERYQSARDVAFALEAVTSGSGVAAAAVAEMRPRRALRWAAIGAVLVAAGAIGALAQRWLAEPHRTDSPVVRYEAYSGLDSAPAISPDGKTMAFVSTRDGTARIWLKQLIGSSEAALTTGPDNYPRFHPDGTSVLFIRRENTREALYRQPVLGGEARRLVTDVRQGDWSPDGRRIAMVRWSLKEGRPQSALLVSAADGSQVRQIATLDATSAHPRWSPDGTQLVTTEVGVQSGTSRRLFFTSMEDGTTRVLQSALISRRLSAPAWVGNGRSVIYAQAESVTADTSGSSARIYQQDVTSGAARMLLWSPVFGDHVDIAADGSLVWDGLATGVNIRLLPMNTSPGEVRWLTRGESSDRQPIFTRDGEWIIFSSKRTGNLDLWAVAPASGQTRRLTDDAADDWDPALTHDGRLLWSSTRGGHFEVWMANADGSDARQVSSDGVDAENPTATPDGWIVYSSGNPEKRGLWKVKFDGTGAQRLTASNVLVPDVSPDGRYVAATVQSYDAAVRILVWRVSDGVQVPFEIVLPGERLTFAVGRTRWMPDGKRLAFIGLNERGARAVYVQDFVPGRDTTGTRRPLGGFDADTRADSFAIAPDGTSMALAAADQLWTILRADGLPGVRRPTQGGQ